MSKKKIIIFHPALAPYRIDFFNKLFQSFDASFYFSLDNLKDQKFNQDQLGKEILFKFNLLTSGFEYNNRSFRYGIYKIIKNKSPEIILCSEYSQITLSVIIYKYLFNRKLKVYVISDDSIDYSTERKGLRKWIRDIVSHMIDGIIFPSEKVASWYLKNVNSKTKTLELPIVHSNDTFRNKLLLTQNKAELNIQKYNLTGKKVFLFVGRLVKLKNIDFLIEAFAQAERDNKILVIIGGGEEAEPLKEVSTKLKINESCIFLGRLEGDELLAWFNIAQCLVLPSYSEAYGAVVNEALLSGCKVLCSKNAGASVLINNKNGFTFDPRDRLQLTELIDRISTNIEQVTIPLKTKPDLMPFTLDEKLKILFSQL